MKKTRENNMDLLRLICCIAVIIIHVTVGYYDIAMYADKIGRIYNEGIEFTNLMNCITRFAVPCFVMLAGGFALSKKQDAKSFYNKKIKTILIPTLIISVLYFIYFLLKIIGASIINNTEILKVDIVNLIISFVRGECGYHMWYLYMMIFIYAITPILYDIKEKIGDRKFHKLGIFLLVISIPFALTSTHRLNYDFGFSIYYVGYFILGYTLKKKVVKKSNVKFMTYFILAMMLLIINLFIRLHAIKQGIPDFKYELPYLGHFDIVGNFNILIVLASILTYKAFANLSFKKNILGITKYTFYIYLMHVLVIDVLNYFVLKLTITPYIAIPLYTIIVFIGSLILSKIYLFIYKKIEMVIKFAKSAKT